MWQALEKLVFNLVPFEGGWFVTSSVLYPLLKKIRAEFSIEFPVMHTFKGVACTGNIIKEEDNINILSSRSTLRAGARLSTSTMSRQPRIRAFRVFWCRSFLGT